MNNLLDFCREGDCDRISRVLTGKFAFPTGIFWVLFCAYSVSLCIFACAASEHAADKRKRTFEVRYSWDNGVKSLEVLNAKSGAEEPDPAWRERVAREAGEVIPKFVKFSNLGRATGRFYIVFLGDREPYLPQVIWPSMEDPDAVRDPQVTPLMRALSAGDITTAKGLIAAHVDLNASDQHGSTALMRAAGNPNGIDLVQDLVLAGARVNARNMDGETALFDAASAGILPAVNELIHHGADVNTTTVKYGTTALMSASQGSVAVVRYLLANGAKVNAKDAQGETALMRAAMADRSDIVKVMIEAGADVNTRDDGGRTALSRARDEHFTKIVQMFRQAGAQD